MSTALIVAEDGEVPGATREEKEKTLKHWHEFNLDHYYESIQDHTFKTEFVKFTKKEAQSFLKVARLAQLDDKDKSRINKLKKRIAQAIERTQESTKEQKVFVRLSTRSPKDAVDKRPDLITPLLAGHLKAMAQQCATSPSELSYNDKLICIRRAFRDVMGVTNVDEAIDLFSYSARIISDIKRAIDLDKWDIHVVVRSFSSVPIEGELRGFVHNGRLRALSQYYSECHFPKLVSEKEEVAKKVKSFHKSVKKLLSFSSYIFDVVVYDDKSIKVVELNPFGQHTGAALFSWKHDEAVLTNGPFEFRAREQTLDNETLKAMLTPWQHLITKALQKL